jgi:hypothetical protein
MIRPCEERALTPAYLPANQFQILQIDGMQGDYFSLTSSRDSGHHP